MERGNQLPMSRVLMIRYIQTNGHLRLTGHETTADLREALNFLRAHTLSECRRPELGTPIEALLTRELKASPGRPKSVSTVDLSDLSL